MAWRRWKIADLKSDWKFKQEYPANIQEAFQTSGETFIRQQMIMKARKTKVHDAGAPLVIGLDPARNRDRTVFAWRRGREFVKYRKFTFDQTASEAIEMEIVGLAARIIQEDRPDLMPIDTGYGWGIISRLRELGFGDVVVPVNFGGEASNPEMFLNKRAEIWWTMRDWLHCEDGEVQIPDDDALHKDLAIMPPEKRTSTNRIQLVSKDMLRQKFRFSPDIGDALALTFAFPVRRLNNGEERVRKKIAKKADSPLATLKRMRQYQQSSR
jgi:hypothetical protein